MKHKSSAIIVTITIQSNKITRVMHMQILRSLDVQEFLGFSSKKKKPVGHSGKNGHSKSRNHCDSFSTRYTFKLRL